MHDIDWAQALLDVLIFWILTTPHEFAHAWVADRLGDDTPRMEGRVTLNPLAHVDWLGTVLVPLLSSMFGGVFFGWGRSVNTNILRLKGHYTGLMWVALAGPASNVVFAVVLALFGMVWLDGREILFRASYLSLFLALFNLIPVPPLDGSKVLLTIPGAERLYEELSRFGFVLLMVGMSATGLGRLLSQWSLMGAIALFSLFR